jgi:UDP-2,3-diacylglucosamine pyrophosphatase LpxH
MIPSFDFILIKDPHFMFGFRSNIRKHGWEKDIDDKIDQIITYALNNNIENIFFTGDVFEKNRKKDWSFNQHQQNKARLKKFKRAGLKVFSNMGNHDYFDGKETPEGTIFGEMVENGLINYIGTSMPPITFKVSEEFKVYLFGIDHHQAIDKILDELERISMLDLRPKIVLMHSNITDTQEIVSDFTYNQLSKYNIDVIGCGHWHLAPEKAMVQKVNDTYFLNPWNLTRVVRDYHVKLDEHVPTIIHGRIVPVGDDYSFNFKEIPLRVKPFSEAFNVDIINFLQELGKTEFSFFEEVDLDDEEMLDDDAMLIESLAQAYNIPEESVKLAKELLS